MALPRRYLGPIASRWRGNVVAIADFAQIDVLDAEIDSDLR